MAVRVDCDLTFERVADAGEAPAQQLDGTLRSSGSELVLTLTSIPSSRISLARPLIRVLATALQTQGLVLQVRTPEGEQVRIGSDVRGGLLSRLATGTRHVRIVSWRGVLASTRRGGRVALTSLLPPPTPVPLSPTFVRQPHSVRTTHDPGGGGRPRLYFASPDDHQGEPPRVVYLPQRDTVIGSGEGCDLQLVGLVDRHAIIRRTDIDEYTIEPAGSGEVRVGGGVITSAVLMRTGTRVELAGWRMSYFREEFADHGRPYGGRIGGELGYQRPQARPEFRTPD